VAPAPAVVAAPVVAAPVLEELAPPGEHPPLPPVPAVAAPVVEVPVVEVPVVAAPVLERLAPPDEQPPLPPVPAVAAPVVAAPVVAVVASSPAGDASLAPYLPVFTSVAPDPTWTLPTRDLKRATTLDLVIPSAGEGAAALPVEEVCGSCANPRVATARFCPHCGTPYPAAATAPAAPSWVEPPAAALAPATPLPDDPFSAVPDVPPAAAPGKVTPTMVMRMDPAEQKRLLARLLAESSLTVEQLGSPSGDG